MVQEVRAAVRRPKERLVGHLPLGRRGLNPGVGALRRSEPMGPRGTPMYPCPWHNGFNIRMDVGKDQLQAMVASDESTASARGAK